MLPYQYRRSKHTTKFYDDKKANFSRLDTTNLDSPHKFVFNSNFVH